MPNSSLNWQFWFLKPNLRKNSTSCRNLKKWTPTLNSAYLIRIGTKFQLKLTIMIFWTNFGQKGYLRSKRENGKSEYHHRILHIRVGLGTKFQLKLLILSFWTKLNQKEYFRSKMEKQNTTIECYIFQLI